MKNYGTDHAGGDQERIISLGYYIHKYCRHEIVKCCAAEVIGYRTTVNVQHLDKSTCAEYLFREGIEPLTSSGHEFDSPSEQVCSIVSFELWVD